MNLACEAEVRVQNECSLRFSLVSKPVPLLEYIKAISSLVGAAHILAVFEENESLKVFFDDKKFVDALIRSGIHVTGHHVRMDYVVPPGAKIVLSNVDPVILNVDVVKLLSEFGTVVSPVIRPPISDDTELCHIGYGVRYLYMVLNEGIPNKIEFKYGEQIYTVKARVEEKPSSFYPIPFIKTDDSESNYDETSTFESLPGPSGIENGMENSDPYVVHVEGNSQLHIESSTSLKLPNKVKSGGRRASVKLTNKARKGGRRGPGRPKKEMLIKRKKVTATTQAARRIRKNVKQKFMSVRINRIKKNTKNGKKSKAKSTRAKTLDIDTVSIPSSTENLDADMSDKVYEVDMDKVLNLPYKPVLDMQNLQMFIDEVKRHRAPIELARKYIGDSDDSIQVLYQQLHDYNATHNDVALKQRVIRVLKCLKETM